MTRRLDRRPVLLACSLLLAASSVAAALATSFPVLLAGRLLLGAAIGGFWSMAAATAMRLVPDAVVPSALSIIFSAGSVATVIAAPLGSALGDRIGWRGVFLIPAGLGLLTATWQWFTLPAMPPRGKTTLRTLLDVIRRPSIAAGLGSAMLSFVGHFAFFTYLRPYLELVTGVSVHGLTAILLGFGVAGFVGTSLAARLTTWNLRATLTLAPLLLAVLAAAVIAFGGAPAMAAVLVALWGLGFGTIPVGWSIWLTRTVPDEAEVAGGILVASVQVAITAGAAGGGLAFDALGARAPFVLAGVAVLLAALVARLGLPAGTPDVSA